jgi:hypothetical protein
VTSRPAAQTPRRRLGVAAAALVAALGLSACQVASPATTTYQYDPADGVSVQVGDVRVLDLLVVSEGAGAPGVVSGSVVNTAREEVEVTMALQTADGRTDLSPALTVPPTTSVRADGEGENGSGEPVRIDTVEVRAGQMVTLRVSTSTGETESRRVPVLLPEGSYAPYAEVLGGE